MATDGRRFGLITVHKALNRRELCPRRYWGCQEEFRKGGRSRVGFWRHYQVNHSVNRWKIFGQSSSLNQNPHKTCKHSLQQQRLKQNAGIPYLRYLDISELRRPRGAKPQIQRRRNGSIDLRKSNPQAQPRAQAQIVEFLDIRR